ncbi:MAG: M55 family metallopeptidase [Sedimentisphaeraceae bacterium JB056]
MKIMIRSDIEGVTGVTTYQQAEGSELGREMLMNDLLACIKGILATGEHEIIIYDEHTDGRNVDISQLPDSVSVIMGKPAYRKDWGGIDSSYDAMMMVGFHARSGVEGALLPHSYSRKNLNIRINGKIVGEIGMEAAVAGDFDVPLWLVTGDSAGMAEAEQIVAGVKTVSVKEAMGEFEALCYTPAVTAKKIYDATKNVMSNGLSVKPLKFVGPIELEIDLADSDYTAKLKEYYPAVFSEGNTVKLTGETVTEVWSNYLDIQKEVKSK